MTFKRENRYHVLKVSDAETSFTHDEKVIMQELLEKLDRHRKERNKKPLTCVVIESDWPEYESAWKMIEARVSGKREEISSLTIQSELELFKKTDNSTHARWVANELIKVIGDSKLNTIDQLHDVTVGHGSGGEVKSGLLWAVVALNEAKCKALIDQNNKLEKHRRQSLIMTEALQQIRNFGRKWPDAGEIATNALDKAKEQGK
jgi:hypothetical protein